MKTKLSSLFLLTMMACASLAPAYAAEPPAAAAPDNRLSKRLGGYTMPWPLSATISSAGWQPIHSLADFSLD